MTSSSVLSAAIPGAPRRSRHKRIRREDSIQADIVGFLRTVLNPKEGMVYANANASRRTENGFASNAVSGLTPGVPDLSVVIRGGRIFYFEVKTAVGSLSEEQRRMKATLEEMGVPVAVVRSIDDVRTALAVWDLKTRETRPAIPSLAGDAEA